MTRFFFYLEGLIHCLELNYSKSGGSGALRQRTVRLVSSITLNFNFITSQMCKMDKGINGDEEIYPV